MEDNVTKFPNQHFQTNLLGPTMPPFELSEPMYSEKDDYLFDLCHDLCEELFPGYEWGDEREFDFDQLMEFTKELLKKPNLLEIAFKLLTLDDSKKEI